jgi:hypothetical protein
MIMKQTPMKHSMKIATLMTTLAFCGSLSAQTTFHFEFDDNSLPGIQPPIVGTGAFTFATDPGDGTFPVSDLGAFTMDFNFTDGESFNQSDIVSKLSQLLVVITGTGSSQRLQFSDTGPNNGGGPYHGSLDLMSGSDYLAFAPATSPGLEEYIVGRIGIEGHSHSGDYLATTPDHGSTFWLLGIGCGALTLAATRRSPKTGLLSGASF